MGAIIAVGVVVLAIAGYVILKRRKSSAPDLPRREPPRGGQ